MKSIQHLKKKNMVSCLAKFDKNWGLELLLFPFFICAFCKITCIHSDCLLFQYTTDITFSFLDRYLLDSTKNNLLRKLLIYINVHKIICNHSKKKILPEQVPNEKKRIHKWKKNKLLIQYKKKPNKP